MYFLDNDILTYASLGREQVLSRLLQVSFDDIAISSVIVEELLKDKIDAINTARSRRQPIGAVHFQFAQTVKYVSAFNIVEYTDAAEALYGTFGKGTTNIGKFDARLVAHAKVAGTIIVTNNLDDFHRICDKEGLSGVRIETWAR